MCPAASSLEIFTTFPAGTNTDAAGSNELSFGTTYFLLSSDFIIQYKLNIGCVNFFFPSLSTSFPIHGRKWWSRCLQEHAYKPALKEDIRGTQVSTDGSFRKLLTINFAIFVSRKYDHNRHCIAEIASNLSIINYLLLCLLCTFIKLKLSQGLSIFMSSLVLVCCTDNKDVNHVTPVIFRTS